GEPAPGERLLVPGAVRPLAVDQPARAAVGTLRGRAAGGDQTEQRPGGLRGRALAASARHRFDIGGARLSPAAVGILPLFEPAERPANGEAVHVLASGRERGQDCPDSVEVIDSPAAEPGPFLLLLRVQVAERA